MSRSNHTGNTSTNFIITYDLHSFVSIGFIVSLLDTPKARQVFDDEAFWDVRIIFMHYSGSLYVKRKA